ncbi:MAG TPA: flagellar biosynthetic protein FliO [Bryobacteraceae bacterium]|nr:flagellar biosynthetic protein FliO [Bryobacteraceae bacterium]
MEEIQQAVIVMGVLAAFGIALYVLRNRGMVTFGVKGLRTSEGRKLQAIERLPLTAQHSLHLVKVSGRVMLIAVSPGGCSVLDGSGWNNGREDGSIAE